MKLRTVVLVSVLALSTSAFAEIKQSGADHFLIAFSAQVAAPPARVYTAIGQVERWWSAAHTWSGSAANLSLRAEAGGCFCERWKGGSVEHGRVIMAMHGEMLRLDAALGPLQEYALNGTLSFHLSDGDEGATQLNVDYRVNGSSNSGLDQLAAPVDKVLGAQLDRLLRYIDKGDPEPIPESAPAEAPGKQEARAELIEEWGRQAEAEQALKDAANTPPARKPTAPPKP